MPEDSFEQIAGDAILFLRTIAWEHETDKQLGALKKRYEELGGEDLPKDFNAFYERTE